MTGDSDGQGFFPRGRFQDRVGSAQGSVQEFPDGTFIIDHQEAKFIFVHNGNSSVDHETFDDKECLNPHQHDQERKLLPKALQWQKS
jgi:hypothetical protein